MNKPIDSLVVKLNRLSQDRFAELLTPCCASEHWVQLMSESRPFADEKDLLEAVEAAAAKLSENDWLEAFDAHPQIGDVKTLKEKYASTKKLAGSEQSGVILATDEEIDQLAQYNIDYLKKFGFIYIIFATGKSATQMLTILKKRINNSREQEIKNASEEQIKITKLRLKSLTC